MIIAMIYPELRDEAWLRKRYIEDRMTRQQIASELGCGDTTVLTYLKRHGITRRPGGTPRVFTQLDDVAWLRDQYESQGKTMKQIAAEVGCTEPLVRQALHKHAIEVRSGRAAQIRDAATHKISDVAWLRQRYIADQASATEIAAEIGVSPVTIKNALVRHEIPVRSLAETMRIRSERTMDNPLAARRLRDADWLREMYVERELATTKIAELLGCGFRAVNHALERAGIPRRSLTEATRLSVRMSEEATSRLDDRDWLHHAYVVQLRPAKHIASELGVSDGTVQNALQRHGIELRSVEQARQVYHRAAINGYDAAQQKHFLTVAKDAGEVGKAYTQVVALLGRLDKVPYTGRENSRLEREAMDGLYRAQDALSARLLRGSE